MAISCSLLFKLIFLFDCPLYICETLSILVSLLGMSLIIEFLSFSAVGVLRVLT